MKRWPTISHTTLDKCNNGEVVRIAKRYAPPLGIVCEYNGRGKGVIFLGAGSAIYHDVTDPKLFEVFKYDCDPVLLLDHDSLDTYSQQDMRSRMGLIVFFKSGCYMNAYQPDNMPKPELQFDLKSKIIDGVTIKKGDNEGVAFKRWGLALINPYISNANPVEIFNMRIS